MSFTLCNLIIFFACLKDLRRGIRVKRQQERPHKRHRIAPSKLVQKSHLSPLPIFSLKKTPPLRMQNSNQNPFENFGHV